MLKDVNLYYKLIIVILIFIISLTINFNIINIIRLNQLNQRITNIEKAYVNEELDEDYLEYLYWEYNDPTCKQR